MPRVPGPGDAYYLPEQPAEATAAAVADADILADDRRARQLDAEAAHKLQRVRAAVAAQLGAAAEPAVAEAWPLIGRIRDETVARATTPRMRAMVADVLDHRIAITGHELDAHAEREKRANELETATQRMALARQDAMTATTPLAFHTNLVTLLGEHDRHGALTGRDPAELEADKFRARSQVHAGQILNKLHARDVDGAVAWHAEHEPALSAADNAQVKAAMAGPVQQAESDARVDKLMGKHTRDGNAPFSYADPLHGAGRSPVPGENGVHIPADPGTPVYSTTAGTATVAPDGTLMVMHPDGSETRYAGLGDVAVKNGDPVTPDTVLGTVAASQPGTVPGLHYAVSRDGQSVDPANVADQVSQPPGQHDVQALVDAINNHLDPTYTPDQRERDKAQLLYRAGLSNSLVNQTGKGEGRPSGSTSLGTQSITSSDSIERSTDLSQPCRVGVDGPARFIKIGMTGDETSTQNATASAPTLPDQSLNEAFEAIYGGQKQPDVAPSDHPSQHELPVITPVGRDAAIPGPLPFPEHPSEEDKDFGTQKPTGEDRQFARIMHNRAQAMLLLGMFHASENLEHFLDATGTEKSIDVDALWNSEPDFQKKALAYYDRKLLSPAKRYISKHSDKETGSFIIQQPWTNGTANRTWDFYYGMHGFDFAYSARIDFSRNKDGTITAIIHPLLHVHDKYNWDNKKGIDVYFGNIKDADMQQLQRAGLGREFIMRGTKAFPAVKVTFDPKRYAR